MELVPERRNGKVVPVHHWLILCEVNIQFHSQYPLLINLHCTVVTKPSLLLMHSIVVTATHKKEHTLSALLLPKFTFFVTDGSTFLQLKMAGAGTRGAK